MQKNLYLLLFVFIIFFQLAACNTINIAENDVNNAKFFLDARFSITITENKNNIAQDIQNNYQGNLIFTKNNYNDFTLKILSPLNTLLAEIKNNSDSNICLYQKTNNNSNNSDELIPEYCDENIDLLVNYFLQNNNQNAFITISEIPNWLKRKFPKNAQIIYDDYNRIQRVDLNLSQQNNKQNYILIYAYKTANDITPYRLTIRLNNEIYVKLLINKWIEN